MAVTEFNSPEQQLLIQQQQEEQQHNNNRIGTDPRKTIVGHQTKLLRKRTSITVTPLPLCQT